MNKENKNVNWIEDLQRLLLHNYVRGRCQIKFGMTLSLNKSAFTLIEVLVVVLIIGILAAIALPQYQKAIFNSRMKQLEILLQSVHNMRNFSLLENGTYTPDNLDNLPLSLPSGCKKIPSQSFLSYSCPSTMKGKNFTIYLTQSETCASLGRDLANCSPNGCY